MWKSAVLVASLAGHALGVGCYWDPEAKRVAREKEQLFRENHAPPAVSPMYYENKAKTLPKNFNWCQLPDGRSLCVPSWNQHIPVYCGSCWLHGTLSHLMDRLYIRNGGRHPAVMLARQTILNCAPFHGLSNGCNGGSALDVYRFLEVFGVPDESCQLYDARDHTKYGPEAKRCPPEGYCINCMTSGPEHKAQCWPIHRPITYSVSSYGMVPVGAAPMMVEIFNNGPIVCGFVAEDNFNFNYRGGVWRNITNSTDIDHLVEVVGWGESEEDGRYWIVRNSWGTYWGEMGFFRIVRGINAHQLESGCFHATPTMMDEQLVLGGRLVGSMHGLVPADDWLTGGHKAW